MRTATRVFDTAARASGAKEAWTAFWQDPVQSRCVAGSAEIQQALSRHWSALAAALAPRCRVLDLGCGAGAVARELLAARRDLQITGVDFARVPLTIHPQVDLLSDTPMESLPFAEASFSAVVSQFGYEYSELDRTACAIAPVMAPQAWLSFLVHHANSSIVATNRVRLSALDAFLAPAMRAAFCAGDAPAFGAQLSALTVKHSRDALVAELAKSLPSRLARAQAERVALWKALEDALAPERCLAESLNACCVDPADIEEWIEPLRVDWALQAISLLREQDGGPIAWAISALRTKTTVRRAT
jgi:SAM-dependent methyltransferase